MSMNRQTGGNRFIAADSDITILAAAVLRGLHELQRWDPDRFDPGAVSVETKRIADGRISVEVAGDFRPVAPSGEKNR